MLLGPAGSGKTYRCLTEIRQALKASAEGPPLLLVVPRQMTYQLERQLLDDPALAGYTRLHILSFERLANFLFQRLGAPVPRLIDEEGRLMVLRSLLASHRDKLKLFRASARLSGFAQQLSLTLSEFQANQLTPELLNGLAAQMQGNPSLASKLQDLAVLFQGYLAWLEAHDLRDADSLLAEALKALDLERARPGPSNFQKPAGQGRTPEVPFQAEHAAPGTGALQGPIPFAGLWVDGFVELSGQELDLLAALIAFCREATVTFCLEKLPSQKPSWLSSWSVPARTFEECKKRLDALPGANVSVQVLKRDAANTRFDKNPVLAHLERGWAEPRPFAGLEGRGAISDQAIHIAVCANPEAEAVRAAREILRHVRAGGRYREITVLTRALAAYHEPLQRFFSRYEIPFFLDRRESVSHHPLAELTRSSLRAVTLGWQHEDWFAALKTGLAPVSDEDIDQLENEALARGWKGSIWKDPVSLPDEPELTAWLGKLHRKLLPPFQRLGVVLGAHQDRPDGPALAAALKEFWQTLNAQATLETWAGSQAADDPSRVPASVHTTVWTQMNGWLENVELAFAGERLTMREWLPILEAGLANLTVGVIPPALDQVLIGAVDRSRNPDIKLALVVGMNETVFPARIDANLLLTEPDRVELEKRNVLAGKTSRQHLGRERHYAYLACTRARQRLVLTCARQDVNGSVLNPSPFLAHVQQLCPWLKFENFNHTPGWSDSEHASELIGPILKMRRRPAPALTDSLTHLFTHAPSRSSLQPPQCVLTPSPAHPLTRLLCHPALANALAQIDQFDNGCTGDTQSRAGVSPDRLALSDSLSRELAARLYGNVLRTSVSRLEQFAACPFRFFVHSGLRAEERKVFELDAREQGTFQHEALALFHQELRREKKRWRDLTPQMARQRIGQACQLLAADYRDGLLQATEQSRFMAKTLTESLQDFIEVIVTWMRDQYRFDPVQVELAFGDPSRDRRVQSRDREGAPLDELPPWTIELGPGFPFPRLELSGRIDRVDLYCEPDNGNALCVVVDYKSSQKRLDSVLMANGLQLQLLAYLSVLRRCPEPLKLFGAARLIPAGVFYVNLRGHYDSEQNRREALGAAADARKLAYRHAGRFDLAALRFLDGRPNIFRGDQFNYRLKNDGQIYKNSIEAMDGPAFEALLDAVEANLTRMGQEIFSGHVKVDPYRKGSTTACDQCGYQPICRIDPWTHSYRQLKAAE